MGRDRGGQRGVRGWMMDDSMTAPAPYDARVADLVALFEAVEGGLDRYEVLIDLGRELPPLPEAYRADAFRVRGCQSQVWIAPEYQPDGTLALHGDSDALVTRGLVAVLVTALSGLPRADIARADLAFLDRVGVAEHLSPSRKNGLAAMVARIRAYAAASPDAGPSHA